MFGFTTKLSSRRTASPKTSFKPQVEPLEQRDLMTALPITVPTPNPTPIYPVVEAKYMAAGQALINSLPDPTVRAVALGHFDQDGCISRNDMIDILNQGTDHFAFLGSPALASIQTLDNQAAVVGMPQAVQNLTAKVIAGIEPGASGAQTMGQRVDNFFYGETEPAFQDDYGPVNFVAVNEPLWNQQPSPADARVGPMMNDGGLMSALRTLASDDPYAITSMFTNNNDGTYTIRFYSDGSPDYVTVDNRLPYGPYEPPGDNDYGFLASTPQPVMWAALIEKAYAQDTPGVAKYGYEVLDGITTQAAMAALTGTIAAQTNSAAGNSAGASTGLDLDAAMLASLAQVKNQAG